MPVPPVSQAEVFLDGHKLTTGHLRVSVVSCSRLIQITSNDAMIYCSLSVGKKTVEKMLQITSQDAMIYGSLSCW